MATLSQSYLFNWQEIDVASDLDRLKLVLEALSLVDEDLMRELEERRGKGRDDYPIRPTWNAVITKWFGYKLHLLVDSVYELPIAFDLDIASSSDMTHLLPLVEDVEEHHPTIQDDMNENAADKGYDSKENNAALYDDHHIKPVIDTRELWKTKTHETLFPERYDVFSYDETGRIFCTCPSESPSSWTAASSPPSPDTPKNGAKPTIAGHPWNG